MKDMYQIFDESFETLQKLLDSFKLGNCYHLATNLTIIASASDFKRGVLISEIFEGIFKQLEDVVNGYEISKDDKTTLKNQLKEQIGQISANFKNENKEKIYDALVNIRSIATKFQFKCWNTLPSKEPSTIRRIIRERY